MTDMNTINEARNAAIATARQSLIDAARALDAFGSMADDEIGDDENDAVTDGILEDDVESVRAVRDQLWIAANYIDDAIAELASERDTRRSAR